MDNKEVVHHACNKGKVIKIWKRLVVRKITSNGKKQKSNIAHMDFIKREVILSDVKSAFM